MIETELPAGIFPILKDSESIVVVEEPFTELLSEVLFAAVVQPDTPTTVTIAPVALAVPSFVIRSCNGFGYPAVRF